MDGVAIGLAWSIVSTFKYSYGKYYKCGVLIVP